VVSAYHPIAGESPDSAQISGTPFRWVPILKYWSIGYNPAVQGVASASMENPPNEGAARAFDGGNSRWLAVANTCWLQYQFTNGTTWAVTRYQLLTCADATERNPTAWNLLGSNDGTSWTTLDTRSGQTFIAGIPNSYTFANRTAYQYYRLNITANVGNGITQLAELVLWADGDITLPVTSGRSLHNGKTAVR
jgi:hypothetical protein